MNKKTIIAFTEKLFIPVAFLLKPELVQRVLRTMGVRLPYRLVKHLNYRGLVKFKVNGMPLTMRSYNTPIEMTVLWKGVFSGREGIELQVWNELVTEGVIVCDIGSNNGLYALVASTRENVKVHAFEPVPAVYAMLEENVALSARPNIVLHKTVVSDTDGTQVLYVPENMSWTDFASIDSQFVAARARDGVKEVSCASVCLDTFIATLPGEVAEKLVCKIDVEGAELAVLRGMKQVLLKMEVVLLIELLTTESVAAVRELLPAKYDIYPILKDGVGTTPTVVAVAGVKNYVCRAQST